MKKNTKDVEFGKTRSYGDGSFRRDPRNNNWVYRKMIDGEYHDRRRLKMNVVN